MPRQITILIVALATIVVAMITACTGDPNTTATASPNTTATASPNTTATTNPNTTDDENQNTDWGSTVSTPPQFFYASDVPTQAREGLEQTILAATKEWGNYGPLEYWVAGTSVPASEKLAQDFCARRNSRGEMRKDICLEHEHTPKFLSEMAEMASKALATGEPRSNAGRNGARHWGIHMFSSSLPFGFAGLLDVPMADDQKVAIHEYFHAVQHAHIDTLDRNERDRMLGPVWFNEGGAEFMAQTVSERLRKSGVLPDSEWADLSERMRWKMGRVQEALENNPDRSLADIPYGPDQNLAYDYGTWAHAYLSDKVGQAALLEVFYPNLNDLGWEGSFVRAFGMNSEDFLAEFDQFLMLPIEKQLEILP